MNPSFTVRAATTADFTACAEIFRAARQADPWLTPAQRAATDLRSESKGESIWVAVDAADQVLGFASVWPADAHAFLHLLYIRPTQRRRGIGRALVDAVRQAFPGPVELKAIADDAGVCRFYERLGFVVAERNDTARPPWVRFRSGAT